jgi:prephenate dehydrogenase
MRFGTIAIAGLGLIGGSLARDLAARGIVVLGYDADPATTRAALEAGVIRATLGPDLAGVEAADALVIATPVASAPMVLEAAAPRLHQLRLISDVGSTKQGIIAAAERLGLAANFVGAHPLAGDHRAGWDASRTGLFEGARVFLSPTENTGPAALASAGALWAAIGARSEEVDAATHDRNMAWISHLPQATSTALGLALAGERLGPSALGPGGRDLTRLAGSPAALWTEIALANAAQIGPALLSLEGRLRQLRQALEEGDARLVHDFFAEGRRWAVGG